MATLEMNVRQVNADFQAIKNEIVESGVEVAEGTKTSEYADKVGEVYEAGKKAEYDTFWDVYQKNNTNPGNYSRKFAGYGWTNDTFKPKYDIKPTTAYMMFSESRIEGDFVELCKNLGITFDLSDCTNHYYMFYYVTRITRLGEINLSKETQSLSYVFHSMSSLTTIDKLIMPTQTFAMTSTFTGCTKLANITIEGEIKNNASFADCPLTAESAWSVYSATKDFSGTNTYRTLTFSKHTYELLNAPKYDEETGEEMDSDWVEIEYGCAESNWILEVAQ